MNRCSENRPRGAGRLLDLSPHRVKFRVKGTPQPKGSMKVVQNRKTGRPIVAPDNAKSKTWERAVKLAADRAVSMADEPDVWPLDRPVELELVFKLARPAAPKFDYPAVKPDWDKLSRSTCDAMEGVIYVNDSRIVAATVLLDYCVGGEPAGCFVDLQEVLV